MRSREKEKMRLWMILLFCFPQVVERKVENLKIIGNAHVFPLLKNSHLFNIFSESVFLFSPVFTYRLPVSSEKRNAKNGAARVSTNFLTFFPFPHRIFSRISTPFPPACFFHKIQKVLPAPFPAKALRFVRGKV